MQLLRSYPPPTLTSLVFYSDLIRDLAHLASDPHIVEVGSEAGAVSVQLSVIAAQRGGTLTTVEPFPSELVRERARKGALLLVEGYSPQALEGIGPAGLFVLDGDHNYGTVMAELQAAFAQGDPIVVLHDVGWPCGDRDFYYDPSQLAPQDVLPHSFDRGLGTSAELEPPGMGLWRASPFAMAITSGGPRNGVRTACEDFLAARPELTWLTTPLVCGLGVMGRRDSPQWTEVETIMAPYVSNPTLEAMERHRVELMLAWSSREDDLSPGQRWARTLLARSRLRWLRRRLTGTAT